MSSTAIDQTLKFHLSLNVSDLHVSVRFLSLLLNCPPRKLADDYAKFEPDDWPVVLSLAPLAGVSGARGVAGYGGLNHLGFRVRDAAALVEVQRRLEAAGVITVREDGVECCHARQTKFWVRDPDANLWEIYVLEEDLEPPAVGRGLEVVQRPSCCATAATDDAACATHSATSVPPAKPTVWVHRLDEDFPESLAAESCDEILLQGTFNCARFAGAESDLLGRARAALKPRGKLTIHVLTTNRPLASAPSYPARPHSFRTCRPTKRSSPRSPPPASSERTSPNSAMLLASTWPAVRCARPASSPTSPSRPMRTPRRYGNHRSSCTKAPSPKSSTNPALSSAAAKE